MWTRKHFNQLNKSSIIHKALTETHTEENSETRVLKNMITINKIILLANNRNFSNEIFLEIYMCCTTEICSRKIWKISCPQLHFGCKKIKSMMSVGEYNSDEN